MSQLKTIQVPLATSTDTNTVDENKLGDNVDLTSEPTEDADVRQRRVYVRAENKWKHTSLALIRRWKVTKSNNMTKCVININGVMVKPSAETDNFYIFDFRKLREKWVNLMGMTAAECDMIALEEALLDRKSVV